MDLFTWAQLGGFNDMPHWLDNGDSYICPKCGFETDNPNRFQASCPRCGFRDAKDGDA